MQWLSVFVFQLDSKIVTYSDFVWHIDMDTAIGTAKGKTMPEAWCGWEPNSSPNSLIEGESYYLQFLAGSKIPDDNLGIVT